MNRNERRVNKKYIGVDSLISNEIEEDLNKKNASIAVIMIEYLMTAWRYQLKKGFCFQVRAIVWKIVNNIFRNKFLGRFYQFIEMNSIKGNNN